MGYKYLPQIEQADFMTKEELQEYLSISRRSYFRMKKNPLFPKPILINNVEYWDKTEIDTFLNIGTDNEIKLFTISEILELLHICRATFYKIRKSGLFPQAFTVTGNSRTPRWKESDVRNFLAAREKFSKFSV